MAKEPQYRTPPRPVILVTPDEGEEWVRRDTPNAVTMDGKAVAAQPHAMFSVGLDNGHSERGHLGGKNVRTPSACRRVLGSWSSRRRTT